MAALPYLTYKNILPTPHINIIYNGIPNNIKPKKLLYKYRQTKTKIGYIGRMSPEKKIDILIKTIKHLPLNFEIHLYSNAISDTEKEYMIQLKNISKYEDRIYFHIFEMNNISDIYNEIDILVFLSNNEGFSLALLEAWLSRTIVVSTRTGAIPELENVYRCQLVEPISVFINNIELAHLLIRLNCQANDADNILQYEKRINFARDMVLENFLDIHMVNQWDSLNTQNNTVNLEDESLNLLKYSSLEYFNTLQLKLLNNTDLSNQINNPSISIITDPNIRSIALSTEKNHKFIIIKNQTFNRILIHHNNLILAVIKPLYSSMFNYNGYNWNVL